MSVEVGPSGFIAQYETLQTDNYIFIASIIPLVYDYIITFDREVGLFWARSLTGASALFFAARYIPMLYVIFNLVKWYPSIPLESCDLLVKTSLTIDNLQSIAPAVFSGLRAFALTKNRALSLFIFVLFLAPFCVNMFQYHLGITGVNIPGFGCGETYPMTEAEVIILTAVSRGGSIISDFLLVMVTWWNLKTSPSFARFVRGPRTSLVHVMLWNGSLYFIILFVLNVLHLSLTLSSVLGVRSGATTAEFTNPLTDVLVCRFLLDLQEASRQDVHFDMEPGAGPSLSLSSGVSSVGSVVFARVMGSIGSTVVPSRVASVRTRATEDRDWGCEESP